MGWRGVLRSISASNRRSARASARAARDYNRAQQRRYKEIQRQLAADAKLDALHQAAAEVEEFELRIEVLRSVHAESLAPIDWRSVLHAPPPAVPAYSNQHESAAQLAFHNYRPGFLSNLFRQAQAERTKLEAAIEEGRRTDAHHNQQLRVAYEKALELGEWLRRLAQGVLSGDVQAYRAALEWRDVFGELEELGSSATIQDISPSHAEVDLFVNSSEVVPTETKSLTSTGKLSAKKMSVSQTNDIYQDHVCSSALRVGREVFATIPVQTVLVHVIGDLLNTSTGHMESEAILSVLLPRDTLERLNFSSIDASDSMKNFVHRMKFQKSKGFSAVEPLSMANELQDASAAPRKQRKARS